MKQDNAFGTDGLFKLITKTFQLLRFVIGTIKVKIKISAACF